MPYGYVEVQADYVTPLGEQTTLHMDSATLYIEEIMLKEGVLRFRCVKTLDSPGERLTVPAECTFRIYGPDNSLIFEGKYVDSQPSTAYCAASRKPATFTLDLPLKVVFG